MVDQVAKWLTELGLKQGQADALVNVGQILLVLLLAWVADLALRQLLKRVIRPIIQRTKTHWDDAIENQDVLEKLAHLAPAIIVSTMLPALLAEHPQLKTLVANIINSYMALVVTIALASLVDAFREIASTYNRAQRAPLKVLSQAAKIVVWAVGAIFIFAALFDRSPAVLVSGLGAMTAVTALIFKDSIMGLVAGLQISGNDLVRVGDWIQMDKYDADGTVLEVALTTVKVQNWDMTIASIPSQAIVNDACVNWRGMSDSGGRRIKRSINLDMTSVRFCDEEMIQRFRKIQSITDYIDQKQTELTEWNKKNSIDESVLVNGRRLTNIGTFRAYLRAYLGENPNINSSGMTFLVRQLQPGPTGMPIEIYVFSKDQRWVQYEGIQADIFDHVMAVIPQFGLRVFQEPTGADFGSLHASRPTTLSVPVSAPDPIASPTPENPNV